jgi:hypothetical protein
MRTILLVGQMLAFVIGSATACADDGSARRRCDPSEDDTTRMFFLLGRQEVQKDLALTTEQVDKLRQTSQRGPKEIRGFQEFAAEFKKLMADSAISDPDRQKLADAFATASAIFISAHQRHEISQALSPKQTQRLHELLIQMRGPMILIEDSALARAVHLGDEQCAEMKETVKSAEPSLATFRRRLGRQMIAGLSAGETIQNREKEVNLLRNVIRALEDQRDYGLLRILNQQQNALWVALTGSPLSIDWPLEGPLHDPFHEEQR